MVSFYIKRQELQFTRKVVVLYSRHSLECRADFFMYDFKARAFERNWLISYFLVYIYIHICDYILFAFKSLCMHWQSIVRQLRQHF